MAEAKRDVPGVFFAAMLLVGFIAWMVIGAAVSLVRGTPMSNALYAALIAAVAPWKLTLLFVPTRARNRTRIWICGVLGIAIYAGLMTMDFLANGFN